MSPAGCHITFSEDVYTPGVWWLELTPLQATKAAALGSVRRQIGADTLISFGDDHNDLPVFTISDHAVAVANATAEVKTAADDVIGANDTDSVAEWIADHAHLYLTASNQGSRIR